jgi:hypothetical protein
VLQCAAKIHQSVNALIGLVAHPVCGAVKCFEHGKAQRFPDDPVRGFVADTARANTVTATLAKYHSADSNKDGFLTRDELGQAMNSMQRSGGGPGGPGGPGGERRGPQAEPR